MDKTKLLMLTGIMLASSACLSAEEIQMKITKRYLNLPVSHQVDRAVMTLQADGKQQAFDIRLAPATPDYWVFCDVSQYNGKNLVISYEGDQAGLKQIYQADEIAGQDSLYHETNRPQIHYTQRRGWNNDPNGLLYYDGEYHLFYQHNPYEREWGNMHWGHAVSRDLVHWEELPEALFPDEHGTMFSGSAVIDYANTSGFGKADGTPAMVAIFTADGPEKEVQCLAYSHDKGRTWTKYEGNPVIDSKEKWNSRDTRDPKVFWYAPGNHWVLVLNERDGHSIYNSTNLKDWTFESHVSGFWECPELFELPVDGDPNHTKWVMYGASGTYMIGSFDGKKFTPEAGKYYFSAGIVYAAQTFTNIPQSDGRRIQIGWSNIDHPGMPFKGTMTLPTVLSLRTTKEGVRLFSQPVKEIESLQTHVYTGKNLTAEEAGKQLDAYKEAPALRIRVTLALSHATSAGLSLSGQNLLDYDMNYNRVNGIFYSPEDPTSMEISADIILDKTNVEVFIDGGALSCYLERKGVPDNKDGFRFWGNNITVKSLEIDTLQSIWK